ncbi:hypothetical protein PIB30_111725, partial [Stylosanthes scabra]|nr:hypothetical protein [Stylosanthes scabra]
VCLVSMRWRPSERSIIILRTTSTGGYAWMQFMQRTCFTLTQSQVRHTGRRQPTLKLNPLSLRGPLAGQRSTQGRGIRWKC